jgi:hypothetical protein
MLVQSALSQSMRIERDNKQTLEKLAVALVTKEMSIPKGALQFDAKRIGLGQSESTEKMRRQSEEPSRDEMTDLFKDAANHENDIEAFLDAMDTFDKEKSKRRLINSLIGGAAKKGQYMYHLVSEKLNEIHPDLIELYTVTTAIIDHLYWLYPEETIEAMSGRGGNEAGTSEINNETDPPTVIARGINFPTLVHELIKGVYEVFGTHGLPDDPRQAEMIMGSQDTVPAEAWDLKLGPVFWELLQKSYPIEILSEEDMKYIQHYLFQRFSALNPKKFFKLTKFILSDDPKGKQVLQIMVDEIIEELKQQDRDSMFGGNDDDEDEPFV